MALNNIPLNGQSLAVTQTPINENFSTIDNAFAIDHVRMTPPGTAAPQGFHNKVTLPVQVSAPVMAANNGIYNLQSAVTRINETFFHSQISGGTSDTPITASILSTTATPQTINTLGGQGWCYLPSGLIMKWGTLAAATASPYVFPVAGNIPPFTTAVLTLQLTMGNTANANTFETIRYYGVTNLQFNWLVQNANGNSRFSYLAIGY